VRDGRRPVDAYLGIPYAAAPLGALRWRPPAPAPGWPGSRDATRPGPSALQADTSGSATHQLVDLREQATDEDCLYLNVWAPGGSDERRIDTGSTDAGRPVLVWVHGGAFVTGSGALPIYDGAALAAAADAVVVTINYRLGALGWLRSAELGCSGNEGLLDQLAALAWVGREIARFGGDPGNVTVFGESAGAACIAAMLARPGPKPFRRAILQSGAHNLIHSTKQAEQALEKLAGQLGADAGRWRDLPAADVRAAQDAATPRTAGIFYAPVADGNEVPADPLGAIAAGSAAGVDVLVGTNLDEMGFFWGPDPRTAALDDHRLRRGVSALVGGDEDRAGRLVDTYRAARSARGDDVSAPALWRAIGTDASFRLGAIALCEAHSAHATVHGYLFDWASPVLGGRVGSGHLLEVPFVFGTHRHPTCVTYTGAERYPGADALSTSMQAAWAGFARSGDPGWPAYEPGERLTRRFGPAPRVEADPCGDERRAWSA
jgi:para-nitrobenzyl esterase